MKRLSFFRERQRVDETIAAMEAAFRTKKGEEMTVKELAEKVEAIEQRLTLVLSGHKKLAEILRDYPHNPSATTREAIRLLESMNARLSELSVDSSTALDSGPPNGTSASPSSGGSGAPGRS